MESRVSSTGIALLLGMSLLSGCSSRTAPAPVVLLNSQHESLDQIEAPTHYTVQAGDTLFAIAWYTGNDYRDLAKINKLAPPYTIRPGQTLSLQAPAQEKKVALSQKSSPSGQTTPNKATNRIDRSSEQAYGESEINVNNQTVKSASKPLDSGFPGKVEHWVWPADGKLVGTFSRAESGNKGIDIQAAKGDPIRAAAAGKVVYAGNALRGYGNLVIIKHTETFLSAYAHNDAVSVKEQQWVDAGQIIATMGNSGTDSVKLHFEVRYRGKSLDPLRYLPKKP